MKFTTHTAAAVLATIALVASANAVPITGSVELTASSSTITIDPSADSVTFTPAAAAINARVDSSSGSLAALLPVSTPISYQNFEYDPLVVTNPIWTSGTTWFNLTSISSVNEIYVGSNFLGLVLFGTGTINSSVKGYDPTPGTWSFNSSTTNGAVFSWGSTATAVNRVPDGGTTLALLGASVLGLGGFRRFLKK